MSFNQFSQIARRAAQSHDWATVGTYANQLLQFAPNDPEGHFLKGLSEKGTSRHALATSSFGKALELDPRRYDAAIELASVHVLLLRYNDAIVLLERYKEDLGNSPRYLHMAGSTYSRLGLHAAALPLYEKAAELQPGIDVFEASLAACSVFVGRIEEAKALYRGLLRRQPAHQHNHYELSRLARATDTTHIGEMKDLLRKTNLPPEKNIFLYYAIGKELEDLEQWDEAFEYFRMAGDAAASVARYRVEADVALIDRVIDVCNAEWLKEPARTTSVGKTPIFIVGLPRSGTTLTERILSSHSLVGSIDETYAMQSALRRISGIESTDIMNEAMIEAAAAKAMSDLGEAYLELMGYRLGTEPMFIEKFPENVTYLGFIAKAFPEARIIHQRRNALDNCFAMYKQSFFRYAYTQEDLAEYYLAYDRLAKHWQSALGDRLIEIDYERLVDAQDKETRRLLDELGLPFEQACLDFELNPSPSSTASAIEIRQKIHRRSIGRWRRFEKHLQPLIARLERGGISIE